ncbi:MAG: CoB--CoM heterodisulfide reductase iron-sulfur subunit B family protein [Dehalococcoidales bacterium]|nr:CoB--CoM heterodisulfide reductase iron-sulfur subunit B family protein [Dehalococcoidales bacterium]
MKIGYYPGCTLHSSAKEYDLSAQLVLHSLGIELEEIKDWNCCGAFEAASISHLLSLALPARNLSTAGKEFQKVIIPCSACLLAHVRVKQELSENERLKQEVSEIIGQEAVTDLDIKHPLDVLVNDVRIEKIKGNLKRSLNGLRVACYYGCVIVRPSQFYHFDDPNYPQSMDEIITALGGQSLAFPYKVKCCGGALLLPNEEIALEMTKSILLGAKDAGAQCILVVCPMCHMALESLYKKVESKHKVNLDMPILYFTQLIGLAFGFGVTELGLQRNLISPMKLVDSLK